MRERSLVVLLTTAEGGGQFTDGCQLFTKQVSDAIVRREEERYFGSRGIGFEVVATQCLRGHDL